MLLQMMLFATVTEGPPSSVENKSLWKKQGLGNGAPKADRDRLELEAYTD